MTTLCVKEAEVLQCIHKHKRHNIKDLHRLNEFIILLHFAGKPCVLTFFWILVRNVTHQCVPQHWKNCSRSTRRRVDLASKHTLSQSNWAPEEWSRTPEAPLQRVGSASTYRCIFTHMEQCHPNKTQTKWMPQTPIKSYFDTMKYR